jgi:hypothetical protein
MHLSGHDFLVVGYRARVAFNDPAFQWPEMKNIRLENVHWTGVHWTKDGEPTFGVDQSRKTLEIELDTAQAVRVSW